MRRADREGATPGLPKRRGALCERAEIAERGVAGAAQRGDLHSHAPAKAGRLRTAAGGDGEGDRVAIDEKLMVADRVGRLEVAVERHGGEHLGAVLQHQQRLIVGAIEREGGASLGGEETARGGRGIEVREDRLQHRIRHLLRAAVRVDPLALEAGSGGGGIERVHRAIPAMKRPSMVKIWPAMVGNGAGWSARSIAMVKIVPSASCQRAVTAASPVASAPSERTS